MGTVLAKFRKYGLIAKKRFASLSVVRGFFLILDDGVSKLLLDDGASFLIVRVGSAIIRKLIQDDGASGILLNDGSSFLILSSSVVSAETYQLQAQHRDYILTVRDRD